jgi:hypothetical protein
MKTDVSHFGIRAPKRKIDIDNRDYHSLSHLEIRGAKRISRHLSNFLPGFTEDYFRVADNSERTNYTDSANRQRCTPGLGLCLATIQRLTRSHVCDKFIDLLQNPICRHEAEVVRTC